MAGVATGICCGATSNAKSLENDRKFLPFIHSERVGQSFFFPVRVDAIYWHTPISCAQAFDV